MIRFLLACLLGSVFFCTLAPIFAADEPEKAWEPHPRVKEYPWMSTAAWKKLHESHVKRAKEGKVDVLFLGDSITQGWNGASEVWKENFGDKNAANFGIGGDTTQNVLWRITTGGSLEGITPKVVVLMIGTNNFGLRRDKPENVAKGVEAIVKAIREKTPKTKILLLGIFPRDAKPDTDFRKRIISTNEALARLAEDKNVKFLDIGTNFLDKDKNVPKDLMPDYLHLSKKGYEVWAKAIKDDLATLLKE
jgi:beta-glucosidase